MRTLGRLLRFSCAHQGVHAVDSEDLKVTRRLELDWGSVGYVGNVTMGRAPWGLSSSVKCSTIEVDEQLIKARGASACREHTQSLGLLPEHSLLLDSGFVWPQQKTPGR
eukprot:3031891-Amphidinium_carterae.2